MVPLSCSRLCSVHSRASLRCFGCAVGFCAVGSDRSACFPSTANDWDLDKIHAARPARPRAVRQRDRPAHSNGTFTQGSSYLHTNATGSILERAAVKGWQKQGSGGWALDIRTSKQKCTVHLFEHVPDSCCTLELHQCVHDGDGSKQQEGGGGFTRRR